MDIAGDFFLCMAPSPCRTSDGLAGVLFALREPAPAPTFPSGLLAVWVGDEAQAFQHQHSAELRPGRGLRVRLNKLQARDGQIRSRVLACELLPMAPSWQKALEPQQPTQPSAA